MFRNDNYQEWLPVRTHTSRGPRSLVCASRVEHLLVLILGGSRLRCRVALLLLLLLLRGKTVLVEALGGCAWFVSACHVSVRTTTGESSGRRNSTTSWLVAMIPGHTIQRTFNDVVHGRSDLRSWDLATVGQAR